MAAELFNAQTSFRKNSAAAAAVDGSGLIPTYSYASFGNTPAATATDVVTLTNPSGSGKILKVRRILVSGIAGTAGSLRADIVRRSTANSGGTATAPSAVPLDSAFPTAAGVLALYTANATLGTSAGILATARVFLNLTTAAIDRMIEGFGVRWDAPLVIREGETLSISHAGATIPASGVCDYNIVWTEE